MKAGELKAGDKVKYHDTLATVLFARRNGVTITYWRNGEAVKARVSARYLSAQQ
jgi:hypothetical protein